jgi:hypothetical protein
VSSRRVFDRNETDFDVLLEQIDKAGYRGAIAMEYFNHGTVAGVEECDTLKCQDFLQAKLAALGLRPASSSRAEKRAERWAPIYKYVE